jgi:hypothetical protein
VVLALVLHAQAVREKTLAHASAITG